MREKRETTDETPEPQTPEPLPLPIAGWRPKSLGSENGKDVWGAALAGPKVAQLPKELSGIQITATAASGKSWTGPIEKVISRSEDLVVVRYSQSEAD